MRKWVIFLLTALSLSAAAQTSVKNFTVTDVVTQQPVSLDHYASSGIVVVLFTSNECPFDKYYVDRIAGLIRDYPGKVQFLLVNSHLEPEESEVKMREAAAAFQAPYLADKSQAAMTALGAKRSPEAFVLLHEKTHFTVVYSGAIDDNPQDPAAISTHHLKVALDNVLAGKHTGHHQVRGAGCSIRKK